MTGIFLSKVVVEPKFNLTTNLEHNFELLGAGVKLTMCCKRLMAVSFWKRDGSENRDVTSSLCPCLDHSQR